MRILSTGPLEKNHSQIATLVTIVAAVAVLALGQELVYQKPAQPVLDALLALPTPGISVSPQRDYAILMQSVRYPSIDEVAQPMLRLAGIRIDSNTNGNASGSELHFVDPSTSFGRLRSQSRFPP